MMTCDGCGGKMYMKRRTWVKGVKTGKLPGWSRMYECASCKTRKHTIEIDPALLIDLQNQFDERRLNWNTERAELKQKIYYLKMPVNSQDKRIRKIRAKLIDILDDTF